MYISDNCEWTPYGRDASLDEKLDSCLNSNYYSEIINFLEQNKNYGLDKVFNYLKSHKIDSIEYVKQYIARQGYGLDILINDKVWDVRTVVAIQGYRLDILINDEDYHVRAAVARHGYGLDELINDKDYQVRRAVVEKSYGLDKLINDESYYVREAVSKYLKENGYKSIRDWAKSNPDKVYGDIDFETADTIKDFVYKINDSNTLKVESSYESYDAFFDDCSKESFESNESIVILAVDANVPLIKVEKALKDEKQVYKFVVDITNEDGDNFSLKSIISSKEKFNQLLESTINALNEYPQFSKYADDLENCI